ncbi:MAG: YqzL family protein [Peptostreptococcaceae bacterium]
MKTKVWEVFKNTGNIEAYLYLKEHNKLESGFDDLRENDTADDGFEHAGDSD